MSKEIKRVGLLGVKLGMVRIFDEAGIAIPVTLISIKDNFVVAKKTKIVDGYDALVVGTRKNLAKRISKSVRGICSKAKLEPLSEFKEFRVSESCFMELGVKLSVNHFIEGQKIDVSAKTIGKGFAGAMKRHNFGGLEASHGVSVSHRSHGSTGQRQDPGRVFKNKKMAGHMGDVNVTVQNLMIVQVDAELSVIAVKGAVPGAVGTTVKITDSIKKALPSSAAIPGCIEATQDSVENVENNNM